MGKKKSWVCIHLLVVTILSAFTLPPAQANSKNQDRLTSNAEIAKSTALSQKQQILSDLYQQLRKSRQKETANKLAFQIERLWNSSGQDRVDQLMFRANQAIQVEDYDLAYQLMDLVVLLAPKFAEGWHRRAVVCYRRNHFEEALEDIKQVLHLDPNHFKAISGLGDIMAALGQPKAALAAYRSALKNHPFYQPAIQAFKELEEKIEGQGI